MEYVISKSTFKVFALDYRNPINRFYVRIKEVSQKEIPTENAVFVAETVEEGNYLRALFGENIECINVMNLLEHDTVWLITKNEDYYEDTRFFKLTFENY